MAPFPRSQTTEKKTQTHTYLSQALACPSPLLCPVPYSDLNMAPQLSVQLKHCAVQCNNHWCQCNKLIMLQSKVVQRQAVIHSILTLACQHKNFCCLCMHQAMSATTNCSVTQAHTPAIVESKPLHSSVFSFFT